MEVFKGWSLTFKPYPTLRFNNSVMFRDHFFFSFMYPRVSRNSLSYYPREEKEWERVLPILSWPTSDLVEEGEQGTRIPRMFVTPMSVLNSPHQDLRGPK